MIIQENNPAKHEKEKAKFISEKIKEILDLKLPKHYEIEFYDEDDYEIELIDTRVFGGSIATLTLEGLDSEVIIVHFEEDTDDDLEELRECFEKSKNKFIIKMDEFL